MKSIFFQKLTAILCLWGLGSLTLADTGLSAAEELTQILAQTQSLRAEVEQLTLDEEGREVQAARATFAMRKPDHFYWHSTEPWEELMVTNGSKLWIYEPDLEQVSIEDFTADNARNPAMLLSSDAETLAEEFVIERNHYGEQLHFRLLPQEPDALFVELNLVFEGADLVQMQFENSVGQRTSLQFEAIERNVELEDSLFEFEPPQGVEIIDSSS